MQLCEQLVVSLQVVFLVVYWQVKSVWLRLGYCKIDLNMKTDLRSETRSKPRLSTNNNQVLNVTSIDKSDPY